jgi:threonylcarbamoyladenosine tRNA methylthiotransferase MtaB
VHWCSGALVTGALVTGALVINMRTVKFYTLGCKVNQYDTQSIRERFIQAGFKELEDSQPASIYIINTCTVTHKADSESLALIRKAKRENPKAKIVVTGCLTELDKDKIKKVRAAALIVKNRDKERIFSLLFRRPGPMISGISYFKGHARAFLKIQDGCNNFCSYCKVPLVRGPSQSKPLDEIIQEADKLLKHGFKEIVLSGICLGAYGQDLAPRTNLVSVIEALEEIKGLLRIRLSSIEAADIKEALIRKIAQSKKLCRHLHIPLQSGDDEILKRMNRKYCRNDYLNLIQKIRNFIPEMAITTDVLVGFPGESEHHFRNTLDLVRQITPLKVHIFPYSRRAGTPAAGLSEELNPTVVKQRILLLKNLGDKCAQDYQRRFLNKQMDVLVEAKSKEEPHFWQGYTDNYIKVLVKSRKNLKNQLVSLRLKKITENFVLADFC